MLTIIEHEKSTPAGSTLKWLGHRNCNLVKIWNGDSVPAVDEVSGLVICGGSMNVDQEDQYPWMKSEKRLIRSCLAAAKPTLGLCLGGQLMAEALGAKVYRHKLTEAGWHKVGLSFPRTFQSLSSQNELNVFEYHSYRFELPEGAMRIATNSNCEDQGFLYRQNAIGLQFHPESTKEWVQSCVRPDSKYPSGPAVQGRDDVLSQIDFQVDLEGWYFKVLDHLFSAIRE